MKSVIEVLDENNTIIKCDVIKIIKNEKLNKTYIIYKDSEDVLASMLIKDKGEYKILPIVDDDEWAFVESNI